ncbi:MAG: potassium/proton antiporter [Oscillospiraceae bacterium]|jgi:cell volume regulation protein A|nr:potassium/proton antiporter [Oscillospiraceae bacterium]
MDISFLLILGVILILSVLSCKITSKRGLPLLVGFILIGIIIGRNFDFVSVDNAVQICNFALMFIIFTGGFQTDFSSAKPVLGVSSLLTVAGTALTAGLVAAFAYFILGFDFMAAMLLGAVLSATDAASVFSVLNSNKLKLKNNLGSVLEIESGSNDPIAYLLTVVFLAFATGDSINVPLLLLIQVIIGAAAGFAIGFLGRRMINRLNLEINGLYAVLLCGIALLTYGLSIQFGGNGFLAVYIGGIVLGSGKLVYKEHLSTLFSSVSMLMQILLFIVLGILWIPEAFFTVMLAGLIIAVFMIFVARPAVIILILKPFKYKMNEIAFVSWAGLRGASSIVFSTYLLSAGLPFAEYIFGVVFFVCLLSVVLQGSLLATLAKRLGLVISENEKD